MNLAKYGRTVIVDDQVDDIIELIKTLSTNGVSTTYFSGEIENLPENPLEGVSILFLDLELNKSLKDDKDKASQDISVIRRILGNHAYDGTVILVIWTTAITAFEELKSMMNQVNMKFLAEIKVEKAKCKNGDKFDFNKIQDVISKEMEALKSLKLLVDWDNTISEVAYKVYERIIKNAPNTYKDLNDHLNAVYTKMGEAIYGQRDDCNFVGGVIHVLNSILSNEVCAIGEKEFVYEISTPQKAALDLYNIGNMNKALNLVNVKEAKAPGTVYPLDSDIKLNYFEIFKSWKENKKLFEKDLEKKIEIMCEVSPLCDYAQKRRKVLRMLPGVILPTTVINEVKGNADFLYCSSIFMVDEICDYPFFIVFDLRFLFTLNEKWNNTEQLRIQFGESMLMHIQNRLGRQVSNPGITAVR